MRFVRIRSWHRIATFTRGGGFVTRCGREVAPLSPTAERLPLEEKSCETCLRLTLEVP